MNGEREFNYLVEKARMIKQISNSGKATCDDVDCNKCPLSLVNNGREISCHFFEALFPVEATAIVKAWAKEHPRKTLKEKVLQAFPNAKFYVCEDGAGTPSICPVDLGIAKECGVGIGCDCEECWQLEVEDDDMAIDDDIKVTMENKRLREEIERLRKLA